MAACVEIFCPGAKRIRIKVSPNTSLLQVLEEACQKQELDAKEYGLKRQNKFLDLSLTIRFANIPNNATLDLVQAPVRRGDAQVTVALQTNSSGRLMADFVSTTDLWSVLTHWQNKEGKVNLDGGSEDDTPVLIYMRSEICGEENLKKTTLKSLGIIDGRAILRLTYRQKDFVMEQAHSTDKVIYSPPMKPVDVTTKSQVINTSEPVVQPSSQTQLPPESAPVKTSEPVKEEQVVMEEDVNMVVSDPQNAMETNTEASAVDESVITTGTDNSKDETEMFEPAMADEQTELLKEFIVYLGERDAVLLDLSRVPKIQYDDIPDSFFDVTVSDVKKMYCDLQTQRKNLEERPLETTALREARLRQKASQYSEAIVRIHFPNRMILQGKFQIHETVDDVMKFVRNYLSDSTLNFYLYTTPPKAVLNHEVKLMQAKLFPKAIVHFGTNAEGHNFLKKDIMDKVSNFTCVSTISTVNAHPASQETQMELDAISDSIPSTSSQPQPAMSSQPSEPRREVNKSPPQKVPKWLKLSK